MYGTKSRKSARKCSPRALGKTGSGNVIFWRQFFLVFAGMCRHKFASAGGMVYKEGVGDFSGTGRCLHNRTEFSFFVVQSGRTLEMGRACRPRGYIASSRLRGTAVGKRRPTMYRKAKELFENCGVAVTLVTQYKGVYYFHNTSELGIKTVFEEYLKIFKASPESFVVEVPDIGTPLEKKTRDANQVLTTNVNATEVPEIRRILVTSE